jgi:hypothetical protein
LSAENTFSGRVSQVTLADSENIRPGDVVVGTRFSGDFALYETDESNGSWQFESNYTFFGEKRDYSFEFIGGPLTNFGILDVEPGRSINLRWINNFISDGLEATFSDFSNDGGYFDIVLNNYATPAVRGYGSFGWFGVQVEFDIGRAAVVSEPSSLLLLTGGLLALVAARRQR